MMRLEGVTTDCFTDLSFAVKAGGICSIITNSHFDSMALIDTMLSIRQPSSGNVYLLDDDLYALSEAARLKLFSRIGMVWSNGGLVSNLKVRENLALPLWYHKAMSGDDVEARIVEIYGTLGVDLTQLADYMGKLPGPLPIHEKRIIAMVRAMMMEPDLMIYDSTFEGLSPGKARALLKLTTTFHSAVEGRTSIYITADEDSLKGLNADITLRQEERSFV